MSSFSRVWVFLHFAYSDRNKRFELPSLTRYLCQYYPAVQKITGFGKFKSTFFKDCLAQSGSQNCTLKFQAVDGHCPQRHHSGFCRRKSNTKFFTTELPSRVWAGTKCFFFCIPESLKGWLSNCIRWSQATFKADSVQLHHLLKQGFPLLKKLGR